MKFKLKSKLSLFIAICMVASLFGGMPNTVLADDTGLVAHYKFDGDVTDSSGNGNHGANILGNIKYVDGPLGKAAAFDGKTFIEVNHNDVLNLGKEFTFSVWINYEPTPLLEYQEIMTKLNNTWDNSYAFGLGFTSASPYIDRYDADYLNVGINGKSAERRMDAHQWLLLTVTYDGSAYKFFYNGELVSQKQAPGGTSVMPSNGKLVIGMDGTASFYKGRMDDLRIYNRTLSQQDIKGLYSEALAGPGKELVERPNRLIAYYNFNSDVNDYSGFANNGTAVGNITHVDSIATKGAKFNGSSFIEVPDSDSMEIDKGFTLSGWFKLDPVDQSTFYIYPIAEKLEGSLNLMSHAYWTGVISGQTLNPWFKAYGFSNGDPVGNAEFNSMTESTMKTGEWAMLTETFDGKEINFYLNGKLISTKGIEIEDTIMHSKGKLIIGKMLQDDKNMYAKGIFDELRLYNYALDEKGVKTLLTLRDSISVNLPAGKAGITLKVKGTYQLSPKALRYNFAANSAIPGTGKDNFVQAKTAAFKYKSLNTKVAKVDAQGKITALAKGKTTIQIHCGEVVGFLSVTVN